MNNIELSHAEQMDCVKVGLLKEYGVKPTKEINELVEYLLEVIDNSQQTIKYGAETRTVDAFDTLLEDYDFTCYLNSYIKENYDI